MQRFSCLADGVWVAGAFLAAVEDRFGVLIDDRYALRLRTLDDFRNYLSPGAKDRP